jgi:S-adenosyl methyltransferase
MVHSGHELGVPTPTAPLSGPVRLPILHSGPGLRMTASDGEPIPTARADPDRPLGSVPAPLTVLDQESLEVGVPNVARIYDALLGGKHNFAADRQAATRLLDAVPGAAVAARENRAFLGRAVRFLADDAGIRQFLDIGAGLPTARAVHDMVTGCVPMARVVYADNDPVVIRHAEAMLGRASGAAAVRADLRRPRDLLSYLTWRHLIDLARPVAVLRRAGDGQPWPGERVRLAARSPRPAARLAGVLCRDRPQKPCWAAPVTPGPDKTAAAARGATADEDAACWEQAARLRAEHRGWVVIWLSGEARFRAYRRLHGARRDTALSAATAGEMAAQITQAEQALLRRAKDRA